MDGEINNQIAEEGEVVAAGYPVFSIQIPEKIYVILQLKEKLMPEFKKGNKLTGYIPGVDVEAEFVVSYIAPMAAFANWVPSREKGEFEMKTFEVHLRPTKHIDGFRPGMTVKFDR